MASDLLMAKLLRRDRLASARRLTSASFSASSSKASNFADRSAAVASSPAAAAASMAKNFFGECKPLLELIGHGQRRQAAKGRVVRRGGQ